jgi:hypothetical protein
MLFKAHFEVVNELGTQIRTEYQILSIFPKESDSENCVGRKLFYVLGVGNFDLDRCYKTWPPRKTTYFGPNDNELGILHR